jgi:hypothetical protein
MDESIQNDLLSGRPRAKPRRVTVENRKLFKSALFQMEAEGPPLKNRQLAAIARVVQEITGMPVAESSLRALIEDAGLTPPPVGPARVKRDPVSPADEGQAKLDALREEIATVQAVVSDVKDQLGKAFLLWKDLRTHMLAVSTTAVELQNSLLRAESLAQRIDAPAATSGAPS